MKIKANAVMLGVAALALSGGLMHTGAESAEAACGWSASKNSTMTFNTPNGCTAGNVGQARIWRYSSGAPSAVDSAVMNNQTAYVSATWGTNAGHAVRNTTGIIDFVAWRSF